MSASASFGAPTIERPISAAASARAAVLVLMISVLETSDGPPKRHATTRRAQRAARQRSGAAAPVRRWFEAVDPEGVHRARRSGDRQAGRTRCAKNCDLPEFRLRTEPAR